MSSLPKPRREATYDDLRALPPHLIGEILGGDLILSPRPAAPHARATSILGSDIVGPFDRGGAGVIGS